MVFFKFVKFFTVRGLVCVVVVVVAVVVVVVIQRTKNTADALHPSLYCKSTAYTASLLHMLKIYCKSTAYTVNLLRRCSMLPRVDPQMSLH